MPCKIVHADDFIEAPSKHKAPNYSGTSDRLVPVLDEMSKYSGNFILEGVSVPRGLRKWFQANPTGKPCDALVWISAPRQTLTVGQQRIGTQSRTILLTILDEVEKRGIKFLELTPRALRSLVGAAQED